MSPVDRRPVRRIEFRPPPDLEVDTRVWPWSLPAVRHLIDHGWELPSVTVLVGENGSGKSTLVEGVGLAFGFSPEGGSAHASHSTRPSESELHRAIHIDRGIGAPRWGFFLRAETMHGFFSYLEENPNPYARRREPAFHEMSHGESFLEVLNTRFDSPGFYCLDEPESALSFSGCLALVGVLHQIATAGGQVVVATHSPIVASIPGATILEVGDWGLRETAWEDLDLVRNWRSFLDAPERYLRHVVDEASA
ncbi:AAA family ATPase [Phytoactinopolyspora halotolerans]|uniref:AAA family ATPase n=1 Tax=Phytoactinopolyspora halotolerans TaxID=1981512 RepID=A0A6L9SD18_9ACTN|nr:AAA family ATPase [Phytoactinopolyspora halotolerans]NEE02544.1 AAA family ATPase [Phytoactinopolyspora halotolerans]